jgi:DNA repair protein RadC
MKELSPNDRPREKLLLHGVRALGDNELVALVLGSGCHQRGALVVANELLAARGGLHGLVQAGCDDLARVPGIGPARAAQIVAAVELGRRTLVHPPRARLQLQTPQEAAALLMPAFSGRAVEQFGIVLLDTRHRVLRTTVLTVGTLNTASIEPRDVFREATLGGAAALVVFHNHPSGDPTPSPDDIDLTRRLVAAGILMGIDVVDHIILGDVRYCSFKAMGQL